MLLGDGVVTYCCIKPQMCITDENLLLINAFRFLLSGSVNTEVRTDDKSSGEFAKQ